MQVFTNGELPKITDLEQNEIDVLFEHWSCVIKQFYAEPKNREKYERWLTNEKQGETKLRESGYEQMRMVM